MCADPCITGYIIQQGASQTPHVYFGALSNGYHLAHFLDFHLDLVVLSVIVPPFRLPRPPPFPGG